MSWFKGQLAQYAQDALSQAQRSIDRALEIEPGQDPLIDKSRPGVKPRTPPPRRKLDRTDGAAGSSAAAGDSSWSSWGTSTMNNLWENSFTGEQPEGAAATGAGTGTSSGASGSSEKRSRSRAMKLGSGTTTTRKPPPSKLRPTKTPSVLPVPSPEPAKTPTVLPVPSPEPKSRSPSPQPLSEQPEESPVFTTAPKSDTEDEAVEKLPEPEKIPEPETTEDDPVLHEVTQADNEKEIAPSPENSLSDLTTPSNDPDNSLSDLTTPSNDPRDPLLAATTTSQLMARSSSSNASSGALSTMTLCAEGEGARELPDHISEETGSPDKDGWSDLEMVASDEEENGRCQSIGSTASSSVLMLQSPSSDTAESKSEKSERSDEEPPTIRTPTNGGAAPSLQLTSQVIREEQRTAARCITSPVHSEKSDLIVLEGGEGASSPAGLPSELNKVKEILHAREQRLFKMSQEFVQVQEELSAERSRSSELEQNLNLLSNKHARTVEEYREEIAALEDLRHHLEGELEELQREDVEGLRREISEKEQLIEELTEEGEKLAQASFNSSNNVKKLRQKEKEDEKIIRDQGTRMAALTAESEGLRDTIKELKSRLSDGDKSTAELSQLIKTQGEELQRARARAEEAEERSRELGSRCDGLEGLLAEVREENRALRSKASQESLSASLKAQEEVRSAVEEVRRASDGTVKQLTGQVGELREVIGRLEQQAQWREQRHRDQLQELHSRLEDADGRTQDLSSSITASTQPLLRQIQLLKETHAAQETNWREVERNLLEKVEELRTSVTTHEMEKRDLSDKIQTHRSRVTALQSQLDSARAAKTDGEVQLEVLNNKLQQLTEERRKEGVKSESVKNQYLVSLEESREECRQLRDELSQSQSLLRDLESSRCTVEDIASRSSTPPPPPSAEHSQTSILERSLFGSSPTPVQGGTHLASHNSLALEKLTSHLKQSQSEILSLEEQVRGLTLSKTSLRREMSLVSGKCTELEQQLTELPRFKKENKELQTRYDTLLQMYGEKAEEAHELQLDLSDVREAYKAQIEQLLSKVIK